MKPAYSGPLSPIADCEMEVKMIDEIKDQLNSAEKDIREKKFESSIKNSKVGIAMLGKGYLSSSIVDDTGMKFSLAKMEEKKNNLEVAATLYVRILESRISLFELKSEN